jgi:hypothetical protein
MSCSQVNKKMANIILSTGEKIKCKALSDSEYNRLLKDSVGGVIKELKEKYGTEIHVLNNGQVVINEKDYYTLYYKLEDLEKVLADVSEASHGTEVMSGNTYGADFPLHTDALIRQLCDTLGVNERDHNVNQLGQIDKRISGLPNADTFNEDYMINYVALIGEIIIKKYGAKWDMQLSEDGRTWNPYLRVNEQQLQFFTYLYEDIFLNSGTNKHVVLSVYQTTDDIVRVNLGGNGR